MTRDQIRDELISHAKRLVGLGVVSAELASINEYAGTVTNRRTGAVLHYESGITVVWAPWRPQYWMSA